MNIVDQSVITCLKQILANQRLLFRHAQGIPVYDALGLAADNCDRMCQTLDNLIEKATKHELSKLE